MPKLRAHLLLAGVRLDDLHLDPPPVRFDDERCRKGWRGLLREDTADQTGGAHGSYGDAGTESASTRPGSMAQNAGEKRRANPRQS